MAANYKKVVRGNKLSGYGISTYCKIDELNPDDPDHYKCTFTFGIGRRKYCLIASFKQSNPTEIYIDRVENSNCIIGKELVSVADGTSKLVQIALYAMHRMMPKVMRFALRDDSHIYCKGVGGPPSKLDVCPSNLDGLDQLKLISTGCPKMSLAYETILKYNQTWYQQKFGAVLPGFISSESEKKENRNESEKKENKNGTEKITIISKQPIIFHVIKDSLMAKFLKSLDILDKPCELYNSIIHSFTPIKRYKTEYEAASSPRDFIKRLREKGKEEYCLEVHAWIFHYMTYLDIKLHHDEWYIPADTINPPPDFRATKMTDTNMNTVWAGGAVRWGIMKPPKTQKNKVKWDIMPFHQIRERSYIDV